MATGESSPRRQGATGADTTASAIAPLLVGGIYRSTPSAVSATSDATFMVTDSYGRQEVTLGRFGNSGYGTTETGTAFASRSRTSSSTSGDYTNYSSKGVTVYWDISVISGSETVTLYVRTKDPISGSYRNLIASACLTTASSYTYMIYPNIAAGAEGITETIGYPLPRIWDMNVVHDSGSPFTYSVAYCYLP